MVHTKLELGAQENKSDELDLILQLLDGTKDLHFDNVVKSKGYPAYTWKLPEDIVTDYLTKVFEYMEQAVSHFSAAQIPVDIVVTMPVVNPHFSFSNHLVLNGAEEMVIQSQKLYISGSSECWL